MAKRRSNNKKSTGLDTQSMSAEFTLAAREQAKELKSIATKAPLEAVSREMVLNEMERTSFDVRKVGSTIDVKKVISEKSIVGKSMSAIEEAKVVLRETLVPKISFAFGDRINYEPAK